MREIKFRAWDGKAFVYFSLEDLVDAVGTEQCKSKMYSVSNIAQYDRSEESWQRFTGLRDKNGKEIYEGDILKHPRGLRDKVEFDQNSASFRYGPGYTFDQWVATMAGSQVEVIGNIHEHPELLKESGR